MDQEDAPRANINIAIEPGRGGDFDRLFNTDFGGIGMWLVTSLRRSAWLIISYPKGTKSILCSLHGLYLSVLQAPAEQQYHDMQTLRFTNPILIFLRTTKTIVELVLTSETTQASVRKTSVPAQ